ncbi:MAG: 3-hydroxyacyl-CoA dehydrogenase NAD-binding domain-containing protein [Candidatus Puniceispirillaceae bacterium]
MTSYENFELTIDAAGIAWLTIDVKGRSANVLSHAVMDELFAIVDGLAAAPPEGIVFQSGKPRGFIFGADINEFASLETRAAVETHIAGVLERFRKIEELPCPTVILIDGICVGGGLELALAFDRIIAVDDSDCQVGFPEINLGLLPGYGGSARACERMGPEAALQLVLHGRPLKARAALAAGAIDHLVADRAELPVAAREAVAGRIARATPAPTDDLAAMIETEWAKLTARTSPRNMPAPFAILDHFSVSDLSKNNLLKNETKLFSKLMMTPASAGLRRTFQLNDAVKKGARGESGITRIHVIGAGTMGGDIAAVAAMSGFEVTLQDLDSAAIDGAVARARTLYERRLKDPQRVEDTLARLVADADGTGLPDADLVIEAVAERLEVKQAVFAAAEAVMKPDAIMATNTSAIPLQEIGSALADPGRLIGMHFFNPVPVLPLVEIVYTDASNQDFVTRAMYVCGAMKKQPIRCKSAPGFLVNRALLPYMFRAIEAMLDGADPDKLDQALVAFGMPMGPIELCDQVGLDVCLDAGRVIGISDKAAAALSDLIEAGKLGRKTGSGFYAWDDKRAVRPRGEFAADELDNIAADLLAPLVAECRAAVAEGVVDSGDMADAACIFGIGFPAFRGGPLFWDDIGRAESPSS